VQVACSLPSDIASIRSEKETSGKLAAGREVEG
jgi:hypothetical protein